MSDGRGIGAVLVIGYGSLKIVVRDSDNPRLIRTRQMAPSQSRSVEGRAPRRASFTPIANPVHMRAYRVYESDISQLVLSAYTWCPLSACLVQRPPAVRRRHDTPRPSSRAVLSKCECCRNEVERGITSSTWIVKVYFGIVAVAHGSETRVENSRHACATN
ncbi:hypothetical protein EVAR_103658_1 [Eumeta japonica]|uniref:Uncharacterized protein n=1 Tax=Eumeta variegata TaxID=151549 RepID=A0A4C1Z3P7_EUMVA|nr:hypothetical protein EVAR_103658_1 [Eumeta japonica]